jgi:hypothetical protein
VRALLIKFLYEGVEFRLLLQDVGAGGTGGFFFQSQVHAFMTAVLPRMTRFDAFDRDPQAEPPHGKLWFLTGWRV